MNNFSKILVLSPHTDDGELGCGAAINKFLEQGSEVYYIAFSICEESVPEGFPENILDIEVREATKRLGIKPKNLIVKNYRVRKFPQFRQEILEDLVQLKKDINPDLVFMPSSFDIHQDHATVFQEGRRAFKNSTLLGYEFMWNNFSFSSTCSIQVSEENIKTKIAALEAYKSQAFRFYKGESMVRGMANFRGLQVSTEFAEAFEVIRWIIR